MPNTILLSNADKATVLNELCVQLLDSAELPRWEALMSAHHYLKSAKMVGEQLRHVVTFRGQWVALLGWCAAYC